MKSPRPPAILHRHTHAIVGCRHRARTPCHQIRVGALRLDTRQRRTPERTVLYQVLADDLETFLDRVAQDDFRTLPRFVERELRAFLNCGILARG